MPADSMEPTATPPPPPENKRRRGAALPLGDVTNLLPATPTNPTNTRRPRPLPSDTTASACSATVTPISKPSSSSSSSSAAISAQSGTDRSLVKSPISTVYTRSNHNTITTDKRKRKNPVNDNTPSFPVGTASCPHPTKPTRTNRKTSVDQDTQAISSSAPCGQAKKNTRVNITSSGKPILPEDFVKKQRAYFQEIDAFELPEEEASETDLE